MVKIAISLTWIVSLVLAFGFGWKKAIAHHPISYETRFYDVPLTQPHFQVRFDDTGRARVDLLDNKGKVWGHFGMRSDSKNPCTLGMRTMSWCEVDGSK